MLCPPTYHASRQHVVLLPSDEGDLSPPLWHVALRREGCQCPRQAVVLHSPRGLRESLQAGPMDRPQPPNLWWRRRHPGIRAWAPRSRSLVRGVHNEFDRGPVALWWYCRGNRATLGSPSFFPCGLSRSWLVLLRRENIIQRTLCTQLIESRGNSSTLAQARRPMTRLVVTQSGLGPSQPSKQLPLLDSCAFPQFSNMIHTKTPVYSQTKITRIVLFATRKVQKKHFTPC